MLSLKEKLSLESNRTEENKYVMHLYFNGKFVSALNWSAYLCRNFPNNLEDKMRLKPNRKQIKGCDDYLQVGFPINSFAKYLPGLNEEELVSRMVNNSLSIDLVNFFKESTINTNEIEDILKKWIEGIQPLVNDGKTVQNYHNNKIGNSSGIIREIMLYPLESSSDEDNKEFISKLKNNILTMIGMIL